VDNITHSLFAVTLANAGLRRAGRGTTAALVIASSIPDIEVLTAFTDGRLAYLAAHRGPTHGPLSLVLALATAAVVWLAQRIRGRRHGAASVPALAAASVTGVVGHIAMDLATSYGTRVLSPFRETWYGVDWLPIVDIYLWGVLAGLLAAGITRPAWRRRLAIAALALTAGNYALRAGAHQAALREAVAIETRAVPGLSPQTPLAFRYLGPDAPAAMPAALPTAGSPFRWRLITRRPNGFEVREIDLLRRNGAGDAIVFPDDRSPTVERAARAPVARTFLAFSRFPSAEAMPHRNGDVTVHWYDMRFAERVVAPADGRAHTSPFGAWVRLSPAGSIVGQGLGPG
jgi:inner membrane protein